MLTGSMVTPRFALASSPFDSHYGENKGFLRASIPLATQQRLIDQAKIKRERKRARKNGFSLNLKD